MIMKSNVPFICVLVISFSGADSWSWGVDWLWKSTDSNRNAVEYVGDVPVAHVPYEAKTDDEKFLEAAKQYTDLRLTELDACQHKIVLQIRTVCSEMTEEELSKMSVQLLNCQSSVEGRKQYPCTSDMSIEECTSSMGSDTWNAYLLISNRARAVCYAARQQQFRAQTDIAVNKLMQTAYSQLLTMDKLKEGQEKLGSFATETLQSLSTGQESLLLQQERMKNTQQNLRDFIGINLRELTREKAMIAAGHKELSKLTEDIKAKLDAASSQLLHQSLEQKDYHGQLAKDLDLIKEQTNSIWGEIEASTQKILSRHEMASLKFEETLQKLQRINETVDFLLHFMEKMHNELNDRLGWLSHVVGAAGIYTFSMHILYLLLGMIATAYVQASAFTRLCLLCIVPLNLAAVYHHGIDSALDFISMSLIIVVSSIVHWFIMNLMQYAHNLKTINRSAFMKNHEKTIEMSDMDIKNEVKSYWKWFHDKIMEFIGHIKEMFSMKHGFSEHQTVNSSANCDIIRNDDETDSSDGSERSCSIDPILRNGKFHYERHFQPIARGSVTPQRRTGTALSNFSSPPTPPRSSASSNATRRTTSRPSTPKCMCIATCRNGLLCRNNALSGSDFCHIHQNETSK